MTYDIVHRSSGYDVNCIAGMVGKARPTVAVTGLVYPATCSVGALSFRALLDEREQVPPLPCSTAVYDQGRRHIGQLPNSSLPSAGGCRSHYHSPHMMCCKEGLPLQQTIVDDGS